MKEKKMIHRVTWRYLIKNKRQTLIAYMGIMLMVLLMTCVFVGRDSLLAYLKQATEDHYGKWHLAVYDVKQEDYEWLKEQDYVGETILSRNEDLSAFAQSAKEERPYLNVRQYSDKAFDWQNIQLVEGRLPENNRELVLSQSALQDGSSVALGDEIEVSSFKRLVENTDEGDSVFPLLNLVLPPHTPIEVPLSFPYFATASSFFDQHRETHPATGFQQTYRLVGIIETPIFELSGNPAYTGLTLLDNEQTIDQSVNVSFRINPNQPRQAYEIKEELLARGLDKVDINNAVLSVSSLSSDPTINALVFLAQLFFVILIGLVSVVLIYNIFNLSYDERARYLAMLTSVGATSKQKRASVYFEVVLLLVAALPLGFVLGLGVIYLSASIMLPSLSVFMAQGFQADLTQTPMLFSISPWSLLAILCFSTVTVFVSAFLPARKISRVGTIESLRGNQPQLKKKGFSSLLGRTRPEHLLAHGFLRYQKVKSRSIVRALVAFIMIVMVVSYGGQAIVRMVSVKLSDNVTMSPNYLKDAEYLIRGQAESSGRVGQLLKTLEETPGISDVHLSYENMRGAQTDATSYSSAYLDAYYLIMREYHPEGWTFEEFLEQYQTDLFYFVGLIAVDDATFDAIVQKVGGQASSAPLPLVVYQTLELSTENIGLFGQSPRQTQFYEVNPATDLTVGDSLPISIVDAAKTEASQQAVFQEVAGQIVGLGSPADLEKWLTVHDHYMWLITKNTAFEALLEIMDTNGSDATLAFAADEDQAEASQLISSLKQLEDEQILFVDSQNQRSFDFKEVIAGLIQFVMLAFILLTSLICGLNLYNSISGLMLARRKNFVILKSLGMTSQQLSRMVRREFYSLFVQSILLALPLVGLACWLIQFLLIQRFGSFSVGIPILAIISIFLVFGLILGLLHWYCMRQQKASLMEEVRREVV